MRGKQNETRNVVQFNTQMQPQKFQICAKIELTKTVDEKPSIFWLII